MSDVKKLTREQAEAELEHLAKEIAEHDARYHGEDAPTISDADYDALRARNTAIEKRFPDLVRADSPSLSVGSVVQSKFEKITHIVPMLSLDNAFTDEDVVDFVGRVRRFLKLPDDQPLPITAEPKIDGLSLALRYENGELVSAATRGDGAEGEDEAVHHRAYQQFLGGPLVTRPSELGGGGGDQFREVISLEGDVAVRACAGADFVAVG